MVLRKKREMVGEEEGVAEGKVGGVGHGGCGGMGWCWERKREGMEEREGKVGGVRHGGCGGIGCGEWDGVEKERENGWEREWERWMGSAMLKRARH